MAAFVTCGFYRFSILLILRIQKHTVKGTSVISFLFPDAIFYILHYFYLPVRITLSLESQEREYNAYSLSRVPWPLAYQYPGLLKKQSSLSRAVGRTPRRDGVGYESSPISLGVRRRSLPQLE